MTTPEPVPDSHATPGLSEQIPEWALKRATGASRVDGNAIRLQFDGPDTFDAWIEAIDLARQYIHFENYILRDDRVGRVFRDALVRKARDGVQVRVLYDWVGSWATRRRYWRPFREAGVEVRAFNPPSYRDPFGVLQRDHRKMVCVDGAVAFVGGFCVGEEWAGDGKNPPWRDTGLEIQGPAAAVCARAFERIWAHMGDPVPPEVLSHPGKVDRAGNVPAWIIEGEPWRSRVYRETQLMAAKAQSRIWITDPYFVAPFPVAEALTAAAQDDVDVRVLLPAHNNWPLVGSLSRGGYRTLLSAGVRLFEWQGPMIHAKTMVVDGLWSRVGSTNLNSASLLGNWEIDVGVLDEDLAIQMEALFLADLASSMEIVLPSSYPRAPRPEEGDPVDGVPAQATLDPGRTIQERLDKWRKGPRGASPWRVADLVRAGSALGDAIAGRRTLGREDRTVLGTLALGTLILAVVSGFFPWIVGWVVAFVAGWFGVVLAVRAVHQARRARREVEARKDEAGGEVKAGGRDGEGREITAGGDGEAATAERGRAEGAE
ncbi:MAG: phospholipase D-like domain-containing protein [Longimicrobiales bacterium]